MNRPADSAVTLEALILDAHAAGVRLWVEAGRLHSAAPTGALTTELRARIQACKDELVRFLESAARRADAIPARERPERPPLSFAQQRLWYLDQLGAGAAYVMPFPLVLDGALDEAALAAALAEVVRRHESLRTTFAVSQGQPYQVIHATPNFAADMVDLCHLSPAARVAEAQALAQAEARRPFDLTRELPFRATLVRLGADEHLLVLALHHIAADGWSLGVLVRELGELYMAARERRPHSLSPLPIQYADFASWQREQLAGERLAEQLRYWTHELAGAPELLPLPVDRRRAPAPVFAGRRLRWELDAELTAALRALARAHGATLYMTLLAAFHVFLSRYCDQEDIVVGAPIANRTRKELEPLIGFFVNTLVLRADLAGDPPFTAVLARVRRAAEDAYSYQDLPFERLVEELAPVRSLGHNPLVQVAFAWQSAAMDDLALPGLHIRRFELDIEPVRLDLELHLREHGDGLIGHWLYDTALFDRATVERMMAHFRTLLLGIIATPERRIGALPLLDDAERQHMVTAWNQTAAPIAPEPVHRRFEAEARRAPDAVAVVLDDGKQEHRLSYREINERANGLAYHLLSAGSQPESLIGLELESSVELVVAMVGVLKAGGAYLPLDQHYPAARLDFMRADARPLLTLTQAEVERGWGNRADNPEIAIAPNQLAYVIYTSGSTGRPKGALLEHFGLSNIIEAEARLLGLGPHDRLLQFASPSFDAATLEVWRALTVGATLCMGTRDATLPGERLRDFLARQRVTIMFMTPAALQQTPAEGLPQLHTVLVGGESCGPELVRQWAPTRRFYNVYGPAEGTIYSTAMPWSDGSSPPPIGYPFTNVQAYIVDRHDNPVPIGVVGELCIGGAGVGRGYLGRPGLTAEKFGVNPFAPGRWYRTGDLARYRADGAIEFVGRSDGQVKIRGLRVERGEIEAALSEHPAVDEAVVLAQRDGGGEARLIAYVAAATLEGGAGEAAAQGEREYVADWRTLYEQTYTPAEASPQSDPTFQLSGWYSSYTDEPIAEAEMAEWVEATVAEITALRPRAVLEIGAGTGLLLSRIAPACERYFGTDLSAEAVARLHHLKEAVPSLGHVELRQGVADDFDAIPRAAFDVVVLNSVVQYFPSAEYLVRVLEGALQALRPGGMIFAGDVRDYALLDAYCASVLLYGASAELTRAQLATRVQQRRAEEEELLLSPAFFHTLPARLAAIRRVETRLKRGHAHNELTRFRYQAVLYTGEMANIVAPPWRDWSAESSLESVGKELGTRPSFLALRRVPNARLRDEAQLLPWLAASHAHSVGQLRRQLAAAAPAVEPEALWALAAAHGYRLALAASEDAPLAMDALFVAIEADAPAPMIARAPESRPLAELANRPLGGQARRALIPALRAFLGARLPEFMVPAGFVVLDRLPRSPNGKLDREALAALAPSAPVARRQTAPRTPTEALLASAFQELLGLPSVGIDEDFFALGGHSLLAAQVLARARRAFGVELALRAFIREPTVAQLAAHIEAVRGEAASPDVTASSIAPAPRDRPLPASFAQQQLWVLDQLGYGPAYAMHLGARLRGALDVAALQWALDELVRRHEVLRTTFRRDDDGLAQVIHAPAPVTLVVSDLEGLGAATEEAALQRYAERDARALDLGRVPLVRGRVLRVGGDEALLLLTLHHIAGDGWSLDLLARELGALYAAYHSRRAAILPPLAIQYADYSAWQRERLRGEALDRLLGYWQAQLEGAPVRLDLPIAVEADAVNRLGGACIRFAFDAELTRRLRALAPGTTLFHVLLAAFEVLLWRYSGQDELLVGTVVANRAHPDVAQLLGYFVNTLVLRARFHDNPPFLDFLAAARETALAAQEHQELPFEQLVEALQVERAAHRNPLVQVLFTMQNTAPAALDLAGLEVRPLDVDMVTARLDLEVDVREAGDGLEGFWVYDRARFSAAAMERMVAHFCRLVAAVAEAPRQRIGLLPMLTAEEAARCDGAWSGASGPSGEAPRDAYVHPLVHQLIAAQAARTPAAIAVSGVVADETAETTLTYGQLDERANQLAHFLRAAGVGPERAVGLCAAPEPSAVVGLLAILKAGGVYVPIDPHCPPERLGFIVRDAGIAIVLTQARVAASLPPLAAEVLRLDADAERWAAQPAYASLLDDIDISGDHLAYILYTSGSTGTPRGVLIEHRGLSAHCAEYVRFHGLTAADRVLQLAAWHFDASVEQLLPALVAGARVMLAPGEVAPRRLAEELVTRAVTLADVSGTLWAALVDEWRATPALADNRLRTLVVGGDVMPAEVLERWRQTPLHARVRLLNVYGPTEITVAATAYEVPRDFTGTRIPIGRPFNHRRVQVLDRHRQPVPVGVPGELYIGGIGVARGYLHDAAATAARFVPVSNEGGRWFRTGDLVRWRDDGALEFLGRADHQVKVRGYRVEPQEVEAQLKRHPGVRDAAVIAHAAGSQRILVAYVACRAALAARADRAAELNAALRRALPEHMIPARLVFVGDVPRVTTSGKVDRGALARLDDAALQPPPVAPRTPIEAAIVRIFCELLGQPELGVHDHFFARGGHSLLAIRALGRINEAFAVRLPMQHIFEHPTPSELADALADLELGRSLLGPLAGDGDEGEREEGEL